MKASDVPAKVLVLSTVYLVTNPLAPVGPQIRSFTSRERRGSTRQLALEIKPVQSNRKAEKKDTPAEDLLRSGPDRSALGLPPFHS